MQGLAKLLATVAVLALGHEAQGELPCAVRRAIDAAGASDETRCCLTDAALGKHFLKHIVKGRGLARLRSAEEPDAIPRPRELPANALDVFDDALNVLSIEQVRERSVRKRADLAHELVKRVD